jgi:hypothetical protein
MREGDVDKNDKLFIKIDYVRFSSLRWYYPVQVRRVKLLRYLS